MMLRRGEFLFRCHEFWTQPDRRWHKSCEKTWLKQSASGFTIFCTYHLIGSQPTTTQARMWYRMKIPTAILGYGSHWLQFGHSSKQAQSGNPEVFSKNLAVTRQSVQRQETTPGYLCSQQPGPRPARSSLTRSSSGFFGNSKSPVAVPAMFA